MLEEQDHTRTKQRLDRERLVQQAQYIVDRDHEPGQALQLVPLFHRTEYGREIGNHLFGALNFYLLIIFNLLIKLFVQVFVTIGFVCRIFE